MTITKAISDCNKNLAFTQKIFYGLGMDDPTLQQIRAARALLEWQLPVLAKHAGVAWSTTQRFEAGHSVRPAIKTVILGALAAAGVEFIPGGVRLREMGEAVE